MESIFPEDERSHFKNGRTKLTVGICFWRVENGHLTNDPNFDHSEVEKANVKLVNGNQTAQSLMDGEHFSKRWTFSLQKRPNEAHGRNMFFDH